MSDLQASKHRSTIRARTVHGGSTEHSQRHSGLHWALCCCFGCLLLCLTLPWLNPELWRNFHIHWQFLQSFMWKGDCNTGPEHVATCLWAVLIPEDRNLEVSLRKLETTGQSRNLKHKHSLGEPKKQHKPRAELWFILYFTCSDLINCRAINYTHICLIHAHRVRTVYRSKENNRSPSNRVLFQLK